MWKYLILLDRSGSMQVRWAETIAMLNSYAGSLAGGDSTSMAKITLMLFDKAERTETPIIRDAVPAFRWTDIDPAEAAPRGYTPLLDAIGRTDGSCRAAQSRQGGHHHHHRW